MNIRGIIGNTFSRLKESMPKKLTTALTKSDILANDEVGRSIGTIQQGGTGDCWLMATLSAMKSKPGSAKILQSSFGGGFLIKTVNLAGAKKTYAYEVCQLAVLKNGALSNMPSIELAMRDYLKENPNFFDKLKRTVLKPFIKENPAYEDSIHLEMNLPYVAMNALIPGKKATTKWRFGSMKKLTQDVNDPNKVTVACTNLFKWMMPKKSKIMHLDGTPAASVSIHAYAIIGADNKFLYIKNPWDDSVTLKIHKKDYKTVFSFAQTKEIP